MLTPRQRTFLAHAGYRELLTLWRFEPNGSEWFSDKEVNAAFSAAFDRERNKLTIAQMQEISHSIGFKTPVARGAYDQRSEFKS